VGSKAREMASAHVPHARPRHYRFELFLGHREFIGHDHHAVYARLAFVSNVGKPLWGNLFPWSKNTGGPLLASSQLSYGQPCYSESGKGDPSIASQALGLL
jgi:hypothetical protein